MFQSKRRRWRLALAGVALAAVLLPAWTHGVAGQPSSDLASGTTPILEDVQPARLRSNRIEMTLPITSFLVFQGDFVSIPIKLAAGKGKPHEVALSMDVLFRSSQKGPFLGGPLAGTQDTPPIRWVNGYSVGLLDGPERLAPHIARVNPELPVTKYLRLKVSDVVDPDVYSLRITAISQRTQQKIVKHVRVAIHAGFEFGDPAVDVIDRQIRVQFRDTLGNQVTPEVAYLKGTGAGGVQQILLRSTGEDAIFFGNPGDLDLGDFTWRLIAVRRGFIAYDKPVVLE